MNADEKSRRIRRRLELAIPVRVRGRDSADHEWTEMTRLIDVTPFGHQENWQSLMATFSW